MRRLKLMWSCINDEPSLGGAGVAVEKRVQQKKILAALAMHNQRERKALYEHWVRASIFTLPSRIDLQGMLPFCCDCYLEGMPLEAYKEYFEEKQGLLMAFKAHITTGYLMMSLFGIVVMLWWANTGDYGRRLGLYLRLCGRAMERAEHGELEAAGAGIRAEVGHGRLRGRAGPAAAVQRAFPTWTTP